MVWIDTSFLPFLICKSKLQNYPGILQHQPLRYRNVEANPYTQAAFDGLKYSL